jgi:DNA replication protein DnaC
MEHYALLESYLKSLRLPTFAENYRKFADDAVQNGQDYPRYLQALAEQEVIRREQNRLRRLIRNARFPVQKELADFDFSAIPSLNHQHVLTLAQGQYIDKRETLLFIGNPGVGKTHLALALALEACRQGRKVRFWTAAGLANSLQEAQDEHRLHRFIASALKFHLVVIDELGFIPFTPNGAQVLFTYCSELYERVALIVTSNLGFADWTQVFGDERLTAALLDRLTHHAHILELVGDSYRFRQRLQRDSIDEKPVDNGDNSTS